MEDDDEPERDNYEERKNLEHSRAEESDVDMSGLEILKTSIQIRRRDEVLRVRKDTNIRSIDFEEELNGLRQDGQRVVGKQALVSASREKNGA